MLVELFPDGTDALEDDLAVILLTPARDDGPVTPSKSEEKIVDAGGRDLRVTNPDRVIFPATERTAAVTKLDIVNYYLAVERRDHARARAPADHARALAQGRVSGDRAVDPRGAAGRRLLPEAHPQGGARVRARRRGSSSRPGVTPTRSAPPRWRWSAGRRRWARSRSIPGRFAATTSTTRTSCASISTPSPGTDFADAVRVAGEARRAAGRARLRRVPQDLGRPRHPHLRADRAALDVHRRPPRRDRVRPRARAAPARPGDDQLVEGGARRADLHRLQPERARSHDRVGLQHAAQAGRAGLRAARMGRARRASRPRTSPSRRCRPGSPSVGDRHAAINDVAHSLQPLLDMYERDAAGARATCRIRPTIPRCPASPSGCSPRATATAPAATLSATDRRRLRELDLAAPLGGGRRRRHDRPDVAVGRLVEVDDHRRVIAGPAALARLAIDPGRLDARRRPLSDASTRSIRIPRS